MEDYQKIVNTLTGDEISPSMDRNIWESKSQDQGGFEPQLVLQDVQFNLSRAEKLKLDVLRTRPSPSARAS